MYRDLPEPPGGARIPFPASNPSSTALPFILPFVALTLNCVQGKPSEYEKPQNDRGFPKMEREGKLFPSPFVGAILTYQ